MKEIIAAIRNFMYERFNLEEDRADEKEIVVSIRNNVSFKGANLWTLIFAIMIASIGLNVNSTPVVIGAMLISPLMGPLMGVGLGVAINDFELLTKGLKNITVAVIISILTSAIYFYITPIHSANSELLSRTNPSLWDVFIAIFGGLAGIVAGTRNNKSTIIPGVAIATALMPPLCTAGFGIATGNWLYLLGACYLFFINSLFICLATFFVVKKLRFQKKEFQSRTDEKKVTRYIWLTVTLAVIPSVYLAYRIVERSIFEANAKSYVKEEFHYPRTQVINRNYNIDGKVKTIELLLVGQELSPAAIDSLRAKLPLYGLSGTRLMIHQGLNAKQEIDIAQIKASLLEEVFKEDRAYDTVKQTPRKIELPIPDLRQEIKSLYPTIQDYAMTQSVFFSLDSTRSDTITLMAARFKKPIPNAEKEKLRNWIRQRVKSDSVKLFTE